MRTLRQEMDAALAQLTALQQEISELEHALYTLRHLEGQCTIY